MRRLSGISIVLFGALLAPTALSAQGPDAGALLSMQREAMKKLSSMDGTWRGKAETTLPSGEKHEIVQTERVGPMLGGALKVVEGRGYGEDGELGFNAFAVISYEPATGEYSMRSYAQGQAGDFPLTPTADGFLWEIPAGPATIRYTAVLTGDTWWEIGERIVPGRAPVRFFEMKLTRTGDTDWPGAP
jgi:hypothetical protein